ncbi:G protein-coupled receptor 137Ba isoform X1 [Micropterus dolomieu]|uniref:G protein-coupled receptor 137Ba isoform X1 n=2 Tax=Micropterus dolomieu TaxID=147949 RepID=UPI001E8E2CF8|nr:G protein-coupled receptor 137Ba isoform X1 [Micropterus dolomieu]
MESRGTSGTLPSRVVLTTRWSCSSMPLNSCLMVSFSFPGRKVTSACRVNSPPTEDGEEEVNSKTVALDELWFTAFCLSWGNVGGIQLDRREPRETGGEHRQRPLRSLLHPPSGPGAQVMEAPEKEPLPMDKPLPLPTLSPAVPPYVTLGLTVVYTVFYSLLFIFIYVQLWLVLRYRHKRFSYQTVFLSLCLLWSALRTVLFSFYFRNFVTANTLGPFLFWLLYCFPVCLQFFTLSLMNLYFAQVVFKAKSKYAPELLRYRLPLYLLFLSISLVFLVVNLACALLVRMSYAEAHTIVLVRVAINDTLFVLCAVSLSLCLYKIAKMSLANIYLESKGTSVCQVTAVGATVILLYSSRACYNLVVLGLSNKNINSFDYDWYNVSDQADLHSTLGDAGYIVFGVILFVWELLPTSLVVFFFRVRQPNQDRSGSGLPGHVFSSRSYFFDNPRRYDSDDDLAWSVMPQNIQASLAADSYEWGSQSSGIGAYIGGDDSCHPPLPPEELSHY